MLRLLNKSLAPEALVCYGVGQFYRSALSWLMRSARRLAPRKQLVLRVDTSRCSHRLNARQHFLTGSVLTFSRLIFSSALYRSVNVFIFKRNRNS